MPKVTLGQFPGCFCLGLPGETQFSPCVDCRSEVSWCLLWDKCLGGGWGQLLSSDTLPSLDARAALLAQRDGCLQALLPFCTQLRQAAALNARRGWMRKSNITKL